MSDITNIRHANKNYKLICKEQPNIKYNTRECAIAIEV